MNINVLNIEVQEYINSQLNNNVTELVLKGSPFENVDIKTLVRQIEAKKKCQYKLPSWFNALNIYYPNKINIEQTSSEATAKYKSKLISGESLIDLTGGFGVDSFYFANRFNNVTYCEIDSNLSKIVNHNLKQLKKNNITVLNSDGLKFLKEQTHLFEWVYVDPSRRNHSKGKVIELKDCIPNITNELDAIFDSTNNILVKSSPILDISSGIKELKYVREIHVVGVNNEVKELLWILQKDQTESIRIKTVNLDKNKTTRFEFFLKDELIENIDYSLPQTYLYEPNAPTLKAGAFNSISHQFGISKIHKHSHLYTSTTFIDFPGRRFKVENILPYHKKALKKAAISKANITTRNFPVTVQHIRGKLNIKDGGHIYLFFTTNYLNEKIVIVCSKVE